MSARILSSAINISYVTRNIRTVSLFVVLSLAVGQFVFLSTPWIPAAYGQSSNLRLSIRTASATVTKNVFSIDENVFITVTVSNIGSENATLLFGSSCAASFSVLDSYGVSWYEDSRHAFCLPYPYNTAITLGQGQSHEFFFLWGQNDDGGVHVFAPAEYVVLGRVLLISRSGQRIPASVMTRITIQSSVAGDTYHPALDEGIPSQLVLVAPWTLLTAFTILPLASILWRRRGMETISPNGAQEGRRSSRATRQSVIFDFSRWLSMAGGSLTLLNGLFFLNFGFLLSASYLNDFSGQVILGIVFVGGVSSVAGFATALCGLMLGYRSSRKIPLGATILTLSIFSSFGFFYFYNRLGFNAIYPTGVSLGNVIGSAGGVLALASLDGLRHETWLRCRSADVTKRLTWGELENPLRIYVVLGFAGGTVLLRWFWLWLFEAPVPNYSAVSGGSVPLLAYLPIALPIFSSLLFLGSVLLLFKQMSQERRGVIGFLIFIVSIVPVLLTVIFLIQSWV